MGHIFTWKPDKYKTVEAVEVDGESVTKEVEKDSPFDGFIDVKMPKYGERLQYSKECNIKVDKTGEVDSANNFDIAIKLLEIAKKHISTVKLKRKDDGFEFTAVEQMEYDKEGSEVLSQVGAQILQGFRLGKV
jgi:hypothetical protein